LITITEFHNEEDGLRRHGAHDDGWRGACGIDCPAVWWRRHPDERRYAGRRNLEALVALPRHELADEWVGE